MVVPGDGNEDRLCWNGTPHGGFSVKSALRIIRNEQETPQRWKWDIAWKLPVSQRVRMFICLTLHDKVMTNVNRVVRHIASDPSCKICGALEEDLVHILRDCPSARLVWNKLGIPGTMKNNWLLYLSRIGLLQI